MSLRSVFDIAYLALHVVQCTICSFYPTPVPSIRLLHCVELGLGFATTYACHAETHFSTQNFAAWILIMDREYQQTITPGCTPYNYRCSLGMN
ncbi:hypothetical protein EV356DRAFT_503670 [Viridothelium virens]|uniref:Secreted protein n=1 Tax=Viridothelium virens TaxID=1048519 RepID=A0A6A6H5H4_VIRVR|nr:hypothetical protein EV356DRAFT_503670 [Viridothelium virens]